MRQLARQLHDRETSRFSLVLASASPRREELLKRQGLRFEIDPSHIEELQRDDESPDAFATRLAREKAGTVAHRRPHDWILGADTIVLLGEEILGKPKDAAEARSMLRRLSGREHVVVTAFALIGPGGAIRQGLVRSTVVFRALAPAEIEAYVAGGEPFGKAGAYAIQGGAAAFVEELRGSWSNVVGLPVEEVCEVLRELGVGANPGEAG